MTKNSDYLCVHFHDNKKNIFKKYSKGMIVFFINREKEIHMSIIHTQVARTTDSKHFPNVIYSLANFTLFKRISSGFSLFI